MLLALLLACADAPDPALTPLLGPPDVADTLPDATLPPPTELGLDGRPFVMVDSEIFLTVSGGLAGEDVFLAAGGSEGLGPCRPWLGGYCLGIPTPLALAGRTVVDDDGRAGFVIDAAPWVGTNYCFQAVIRRGFAGVATGLSNVLCVDHCSMADDDSDGFCDEYDTCPGGRDDIDSDADGICDWLDPCPLPDDPEDSDGDGVCDAGDVCPGGDDLADEDGDGVCDLLDACPGDDFADEDGDGICDGLDANFSCAEVLAADPGAPSGVYVLDPDGDGPAPDYEAYCLMEYDGGGWTVMAWLRHSSHWDWDQFEDVGVLGDTVGGFNSGATLDGVNDEYTEKLIVYLSLTELGEEIGPQWMKNMRPDAVTYADIRESGGWDYTDSYGYTEFAVSNVCSHGCSSYRGYGMFNNSGGAYSWCGTQGGDYGCEDGNNICWTPRSLGCNVGSDRCANLDEAGGGVIYAVR